MPFISIFLSLKETHGCLFFLFIHVLSSNLSKWKEKNIHVLSSELNKWKGKKTSVCCLQTDVVFIYLSLKITHECFLSIYLSLKTTHGCFFHLLKSEDNTRMFFLFNLLKSEDNTWMFFNRKKKHQYAIFRLK
jgi:hypothetical protein